MLYACSGDSTNDMQNGKHRFEPSVSSKEANVCTSTYADLLT